MLKFEEKLTPEVQIENIMSYTIQAVEILEQSQIQLQKWTYRSMVLAEWPHYYTGILQAMGYLLLDKIFSNKQNLILFYHPKIQKEIYLLNQSISYLGKENYEPLIPKWKKFFKNSLK